MRVIVPILAFVFLGIAIGVAGKETPPAAPAEQSAQDEDPVFGGGGARSRLSPKKWRRIGGTLHRIESSPEVTSLFQNLGKGGFVGTVSGLLVAETSKPDAAKEDPSIVRHLIPFASKEARLDLVPDAHEIYDVSTKTYTARSPQGALVYETYADANALSLTTGEDKYEISIIDGSCEGEIAGLDYRFFRDEQHEYLVLTVERPLRLVGGTGARKQAVLQPGSVLVFTFKKPPPPK